MSALELLREYHKLSDAEQAQFKSMLDEPVESIETATNGVVEQAYQFVQKHRHSLDKLGQ